MKPIALRPESYLAAYRHYLERKRAALLAATEEDLPAASLARLVGGAEAIGEALAVLDVAVRAFKPEPARGLPAGVRPAPRLAVG